MERPNLKQMTNEQLARELSYITLDMFNGEERHLDFKVVAQLIEKACARLPVWNTNMDEAPKDGTIILGMGENWNWPVPVEWLYMDGEDARWGDSTHEEYYLKEQPTAWMHIPGEVSA